MNDLVEFLLDRITEDEAVARAATPGPWVWREVSDGWDGKTAELQTEAQLPAYSDGSVGPVRTVINGWGYDASGLDVSDADAAHIVRWNPVRVLAECEAKRRIVQWRAVEIESEAVDVLDEVLRLLALPYADHPDYRSEWAP